MKILRGYLREKSRKYNVKLNKNGAVSLIQGYSPIIQKSRHQKSVSAFLLVRETGRKMIYQICKKMTLNSGSYAYFFVITLDKGGENMV